MTTIAYKAKIMASDSQLTSDDKYWSGCIKIKKSKGWLLGAAGGWDLTEAFMKRFDPLCVKAGSISLPSINDRDFEALMVSPVGVIYYTEAGGVIGPLKTKGFIAIGSGAFISMTAMDMGANAIEAINMAKKYDCFTGGRVQKIKLAR